MKKGLKIGIIVLVVIMGCGIIFGSIDKKRALNKGLYRLVKNVSVEKAGGSKEEFNIYGEFKID